MFIKPTVLQSDSAIAVVPLHLSNPGDEVAGLQIDLLIPHDDITLDTILAVGRASNWLVQYDRASSKQSIRLLVFDPSGHNLIPGDGPILSLVYSVRQQGVFPSSIPLVLVSANLSDAAGFGLPAELASGTIIIQPNIAIVVGSAMVDQGDTVLVPMDIRAATCASLPELVLTADTSILSIVGIDARQVDQGVTWTLKQTDSTTMLVPQPESDSSACGGLINLLIAARSKIGATATTVSVGFAHSSPGRTQITNGEITIYPGYLPPVGNVSVSRATDGINLIWDKPANISKRGPSFEGYRIVRVAINGSQPADTLSIPGNQAGYVDHAVVPGERYRYEIAVQYVAGHESDAQSVTASWQKPTLIRIADLATAPGEPVSLPVYLENHDEVGGIRAVLAVEPQDNYRPTKILTSGRIPADWIWRLTPDSVSGEISLVAFSPSLSIIPPGSGEVLQIELIPISDTPTDSVVVRFDDLVVSTAVGQELLAVSEYGSLAVVREAALLGIETGFPVLPGRSTGIAIYLNNAQALSAFQLVISTANQFVELGDVRPDDRLPEDFNLAIDRLPDGSLRVVGSTPLNAIDPGQGAILQLTATVKPGGDRGVAELIIDRVLLSDIHGNDWPHIEEPGRLAIGDIGLTVTPESVEGRRGRTVTVPISITSVGAVTNLKLGIVFDPDHLRYLSHTATSVANRLTVSSVDSLEGEVRLNIAGNDSTFLPSGANRVLNTVFQIASNAPVDTSLAIEIVNVDAQTAMGAQIFAKGQTGEIRIGAPPPVPDHFGVEASQSGPAHFIRLRSATLGGTYLQPGDEIALLDSNGVVDGTGKRGPVIAGVGVIGTDRSTDITARLGLLVDDGQDVPGAVPGNRMLFQAWDRSRNLESLITDDAKYIMGRGQWGENNGLTIIELVRSPRETAESMVRPPAEVVVRPISPNPLIDSTSITIGLPAETDLQVAVFDQLGRSITTLHDGITKAGWHVVTWRIDSEQRRRIRSGMLFCRVKAGTRTITRKMVIMR
ncbi:T9SS type A sorting domain-containing protein [Candidatus Neomarinimicrobiota bacterium]